MVPVDGHRHRAGRGMEASITAIDPPRSANLMPNEFARQTHPARELPKTGTANGAAPVSKLQLLLRALPFSALCLKAGIQKWGVMTCTPEMPPILS